MVEPGRYFAQRTGQSVGEGDKGAIIRIDMEITHCGNSGAWVEMPSKTNRALYIHCSDKAWKYAEKKLKALGFNGKFDEDIDFSVDTFEVDCSHEKYEGKDRERWELADWGGGQELRPLSQQSQLRYSALWRAQAQNPPRPQGTPKSPPTPQKAADGEMPPPKDEDIPLR